MKLIVSHFVVCLLTIQRSSAQEQENASQLIDIAMNQLGAPFTEIALQRLQYEPFPTRGNIRSTDVVIMNASNRQFRLLYPTCGQGKFSTRFPPESTLPPKTSVVFGIESDGVNSPVECRVVYEEGNGQSNLHLVVGNPYNGRNRNWITKTGFITIHDFIGQRRNNVARFVIR